MHAFLRTHTHNPPKDMKCAVLALGAAAAFKLLTPRGGRPRPGGVAAKPKVRARVQLEHAVCR